MEKKNEHQSSRESELKQCIFSFLRSKVEVCFSFWKIDETFAFPDKKFKSQSTAEDTASRLVKWSDKLAPVPRRKTSWIFRWEVLLLYSERIFIVNFQPNFGSASKKRVSNENK